MVVDTTNNRVVVQDGSTAGGWPAAKLSEVLTNTRTQVSDANYTALTTDRTIAYMAITAARTVSLPAAARFPTGSRLLVVDESGVVFGDSTRSRSPPTAPTSSMAHRARHQFRLRLPRPRIEHFQQMDHCRRHQRRHLDVAVDQRGSINSTVIGGTTPASGTSRAIDEYTVAWRVMRSAMPITRSRSAISTVAYTAITAARTVSLPASSTFNAGQQLLGGRQIRFLFGNQDDHARARTAPTRSTVHQAR